MRSYSQTRLPRVMGMMFFPVIIVGIASFYTALALVAEEQANGRVTGKILFPDGSVPQGITVYLDPETTQKMMPASVPQRLQTTLNNDGSFTFDDVQVWSLDWALRVKGEGIVAPPEYRLRLTVKPGEEVKRDITVYRGGIVSGRVTRAEDGKPVKAARLSFGEQDPPVEAVSKADGGYKLSSVMPGKRYILCKTEDYVEAGRQIQVKEGGKANGIDFMLERGGFIVGKVVMPDGTAPKRGAYVWLAPIGRSAKFRGAVLGGFRVQEDGSFRTAPEPPGAYRLTAKWPIGKMVKVTHHAAMPQVVVQPGKETKVTVKLEAIQ